MTNYQQEQNQGIQKVEKFELSIFMKMIICSFIGIFSFFVSFEWNGKKTILVDHVVNAISTYTPALVNGYVLILLVLGAFYPFVTKKWKTSAVNMVLSIFKLGGLVAGVMLIFGFGPAWLFNPDIGPFLLEKLIKPVGLVIPIGSVFLALLVCYGLLEFIGVLMQPIMKPVFRTPGRSAVDAVASFVGSYSVGLLLTNRVYKEGKYTAREAAIIATGFSTVSATFMVIVAKTLDLMEHWNTFFWVTLIVTFIVTAITARIYPLNKIKNEYYDGATPQPEKMVTKDRLKTAWTEAVEATNSNPSLAKNLFIHLKDGLIMAMGVIPSILSIGLLGMVLAIYTPLFDWLAYIFVPFTYLLQVPEPMLAAKAMSVSIAEMFLPAMIVAGADIITKFIIAVISISAILFFSAVIPVILSTDIPLTIRQMIIIWFQRVVLTLIIVTPIAFILF
ncbi:histidine transporter [Solibacillus sp. R5-41]|uniref:YjiH family protein n=1 Tax=Solibacillus sp. R5-41 TaxID=2048654 RepID=UPI000C129650|nr:YjiH family protein [Solibacillus sp. R5-41]ATP38751.1 histidine transporter [Solibacillus sp. R5-41]